VIAIEPSGGVGDDVRRAGGAAAAVGAPIPSKAFFTGGFGNPIVSTIEAMVSTTLSVLAVMLPVLAFGAAVILIALAMSRLRRRALPP